ncbi:MAG: saccharopine dehydrogenase NADP-binding domain-containing protein [Planctomycetota bacterium]|nr:saccharopine dehydrogenase NADP-binding domain-containing protein [Planctomycetota bacterium]
MPDDSNTWMIYGANGYTGRLIAGRAVADGRKPILAGRDASKIEAVAKELDCPCRVFSLSSAEAIAKHLDGLSAVLHCAGPFSQTAEPMIAACLLAGVDYLDITGELDVIEFAARQHDRAVAAGISIMPAVGFDVVPSDCLAAQLAAALPAAVELELAFKAGTSISPGTANSMLATAGYGGRVRQDGHIVRVPTAWKTRQIHFPSGNRQAVTIPWGDVSSAFHTTRIPNIQVYAATPTRLIRSLRRWRWLLPMTKFAPIQWLGRQWIKRHIRGPSDNERATRNAEFWGRVTDNEGRVAEATLVTPEGYSLTVQTALEIVSRTLAGEVDPGFSTPAKAFGGKFIEQFDGVRLEWRIVPS